MIVFRGGFGEICGLHSARALAYVHWEYLRKSEKRWGLPDISKRCVPIVLVLAGGAGLAALGAAPAIPTALTPDRGARASTVPVALGGGGLRGWLLNGRLGRGLGGAARGASLGDGDGAASAREVTLEFTLAQYINPHETKTTLTFAGHDLVVVLGSEVHLRIPPGIEVSRDVDGTTSTIGEHVNGSGAFTNNKATNRLFLRTDQNW